jgi:diguanylate cyclase (GGDEF)-like protein
VLLAKRNAELAATFSKLEQLASRDSLTGTLNRRSLMQTIESEAERLRRHGVAFGVALFDLDRFKQINDTHGHLVGDEVLRCFAELAARELRTGDQLGRFGGEEFLVVLCGPSDAEAAAVAAERVRRVVEQHDWNGVRAGLKVTVSAGVSLHRDQDSPEQLLARADAALYTAKREGRNRTVIA